MSFDEQNIAAFIHLLKTQRSLFSVQDWTDLDKLVPALPVDVEKLSVVIAAWYERHPKILDAQLEILNNLSGTTQITPKGTGESSHPDDASETYRELIQAIKQNTPRASSRPLKASP